MRKYPLLALLFVLPGVLRAADVKLTTVDPKVFEGELVNIKPKEVVLKTKANGELAIANDRITEVDLARTVRLPKTYIEVELVDGSLLRCASFAIKMKEMHLKLANGQEIKLPIAKLMYMFRGAENAEDYKKFRSILAGVGTRDIVVAGGLNPLEGTLSASEEADKIHFTGTAATADLPIERLQGLIYFRPNREAVSDRTQFKLHDTSKNVLVVEKCVKSPKGYQVTTVTGAVLDYPLEELAKLDYNKGQLTYLSNMDPDKVVEKSSLGGVDHYRRDKNLDGTKIRLQGKTYEKGLAMHAYTELIYDMNGEYKEFKAVMGIDDQVGGDAHVKVTIEGDDQEMFSAELRRQDRKVIPIAINVTGKKKLRIVVRSVNLLDLGDHVDLADARLTK